MGQCCSNRQCAGQLLQQADSCCCESVWNLMMPLRLQDIYCFVLPLILKWVVAALVVSVLVNLFSKLTELSDKSPISVRQRMQHMVIEGWQCHFQHAPRNADILLTLFWLNKQRKSLKLLPSFIRSVPRKSRQYIYVCRCVCRCVCMYLSMSKCHIRLYNCRLGLSLTLHLCWHRASQFSRGGSVKHVL